MAEEKKISYTPILVAFLLILVLGGLYYFYTTKKTTPGGTPPALPPPPPAAGFKDPTSQGRYDDLEKQYIDAETKLDAINNDSAYAAVLAIWNDSRVQNNPKGWIDSSGRFWVGDDAGAERDAAKKQVIANQALQKQYTAKIATLNDQISQLR